MRMKVSGKFVCLVGVILVNLFYTFPPGTAIVRIGFSTIRRRSLERLDHADGHLGRDPGVGRLGRVAVVDEDQVPRVGEEPAQVVKRRVDSQLGRVANLP